MEPEMMVQKVACAACGASISVPHDIDRLTCLYCGSNLLIRRGEGYIASKVAEQATSAVRHGGAAIRPAERREQGANRLTRYQGIIDVLLDSTLYSRVYFDHDNDLPNPYRGIAFLKEPALQEEPKKGNQYQKKQCDVVGIRNGVCDIVIEEERRPGFGKVDEVIAKITKCGFLWVDRAIHSRAIPIRPGG